MKTLGVIFTIIAVCGVLVIVSVVGKSCSVASGVVDKVVNEKNIVQSYEWYYDQFNAIKAQKANVQLIKQMPITEKQQVELAGTQMVLNNMIAEYNSKSKQITRNLWKAKNIPQTINLEDLP